MTIISASALKTAGAKYGIAFSRKNPGAPLTVRTIREDSPFANKGLMPGMIVTQINGEKMTWLGPREAAKILQKAKVGTTMTVEASTAVIAVGHKKKKKVKCGIWLKNSTKTPGVYVSRINDDSIFKKTNLKMGMKVIQINKKPCYDDFNYEEAIDLLKACDGTVEIVAIDTDFRYNAKIGKDGRRVIPGLLRASSGDESEEDILLGLKSPEARNQKPVLEYLFPMLVNL